MLDDLNTRVDTTQSRLQKVSRTMKDFIAKNEGEFGSSKDVCADTGADTKSSWCIAILIIILIILLVLVILV